MSDYIDQVFGAGGVLARNLPRYEPRSGQLELARAVDAAFVGPHHLLAEAPTGTGKSLAYSVPAAWHASKGTFSRVVVSTANIALQEQLVRKDLPFLQSVLPWRFSFALAKGRSNFVCLDRLDHADEVRSKLDASAAAAFDRLVGWALLTHTGDVAELQEVPHFSLWSELSVGSEQCKGRRCPRRDDCHVEHAKALVEQAHVVVTNYHLLFADMMVRGLTDDEVGVLPAYECAVLDEGHRAANIARDFFGSKSSEAAFRRLVNDTMRAHRDAGGSGMPLDMERALLAVEDEASLLFGKLALYMRGGVYKTRLREKHEVDASDLKSSCVLLARQCLERSDDGSLESGDRAAFRNLARRANAHADLLAGAAELRGSPDVVYYLDDPSTGWFDKPRVSLCSKPVDVADKLREQLFKKCRSVVATSATMTTGGAEFDHVAFDLGAEDARELVVASPFDMRRQALLVVPNGLHDPNDPVWRDDVNRCVSEVIAAAGGRTLALFTSYRNLRACEDYLRANGTAAKYRLLVQGTAQRTQLVDEFRRDVTSVLLGTESFWEGIDVQGEALSCLVIDRLPFPTPDDPVLDVQIERDPRGWFEKWSLPRALIAFRQGSGRLIRSTTDRGAIVLLDNRVNVKRYGKRFLTALGAVGCSRNIADVGVFLRS